MGSTTEMGDRIRGLMPQGMSQRQLAAHARMTPDALSRALNGQRGLSPTEIATIAQALGADTHWLITGVSDPFRISVAARHAWDPARRERRAPNKQDDQPLLDQVVALYRTAFPQGPGVSADLPKQPIQLRNVFGSEFVRDFADVVERTLRVDVIRIPGLTTDYSLRIGRRGVIILATQASWYRSNWSLAHELSHLALGHHTGDATTRRAQRDEWEADAYAAELLVSEDDLRTLAETQTEAALAKQVWRLGVSTEALRNRLANANVRLERAATEALAQSTPRLLRGSQGVLNSTRAGVDPIAEREQTTSARRFPLSLLSALRAQTEIGAASPVHLAWALDVPLDDIDFPEPNEDGRDYEQMLQDRPSLEDWRSMITAAAKSDDRR